jgi:hypothetical protein
MSGINAKLLNLQSKLLNYNFLSKTIISIYISSFLFLIHLLIFNFLKLLVHQIWLFFIKIFKTCNTFIACKYSILIDLNLIIKNIIKSKAVELIRSSLIEKKMISITCDLFFLIVKNQTR